MSMSVEEVDVVVVGMGIFGSSIAWRLAAKGLSVAGLERHTIPNEFGSSHGQTRNFRYLSQNHEHLYQLAGLSRDLWLELEARGGERLFDKTGALVLGFEGQGWIGAIDAIASKHHLTPPRLDSSSIKEQYPIFGDVSEDQVAIFDENGGVLFLDECVKATARAAQGLGAVVLENTNVFGHSLERNRVVVQTSRGDFLANHVVFATGCWTAELFPELGLKASRIPQCWFKYTDHSSGTPTVDQLPPFQRDLVGGGSLWGHGAVSEGWLTKIGSHGNPVRDRTVRPDNIDRQVHPEDFEYISQKLVTSFPSLDPIPAKSGICLLTESLDGQFVLGPVGDPRVIVASGGSGQGFKHAPGVGEVVADICIGAESRFDTSFMRTGRLLG